MKPEDRKRLKQHIEMIVDHKLPAQLSSIGRIMQALRLAKEAQVGVTLDYFNVIELLGHIESLEETIEFYNHTYITRDISVDVKTSTDNNKCSWIQEDDPDIVLWRTGCKNMFYLDADKPSDNHMKYCCYCGREIKEED